MKVTVENMLMDEVQEIDVKHKRLVVEVDGERFEISDYSTYARPHGTISVRDLQHDARYVMAAFSAGGMNILHVGRVGPKE